ncbi:hypothetical protein [Breznakiella homolactica]|uniref:Uncharacterized protein n=1 Tax=Breznakiella homolactica TaxID=2798577 RepID=A0A7T7XQE8_9SPIR|nr:hypothetical protein [Breznakiella homolactica]QQO10605.1 hypothetical protein JFL75_06730 [Breznakiella homolactica]
MKKVICTFILMAVTFIVLADSLDEKIDSFWRYISQNENKILSAKQTDQELYTDLYDEIQKINNNLSVFLENNIVNGRKNIIISANSNPDYFKLCDEIVTRAPKFEVINPVSLIPPLEVIEPFIYGDIKFSADDVRVHFDKDDKKVDLFFFLTNEHTNRIKIDKSGQMYDIYMQMLYIMTQQILGERKTGERIGSGEIILMSLLMPTVPFIDIGNIIEDNYGE